MDIEKDREYQVVKHNDLIQKSRFSLSLPQQKMLLYLISKVKPLDEQGTTYTLSVKEYCEICGIDETSGMNYARIKDTLDQIDSYKTWLLENGTSTRIRWFDTLTINAGSGLVELRFHSSVVPYLFDLKEKYTQYKLENILPLRSKYSIRLYELLASYRHQGKKTVQISTLKELLDAQDYKHFSHFRARVLDCAVEEICQYTNLMVSYALVKEGRQYTEITFAIRDNNRLQDISSRYARRDALTRKHKKEQ